MTDETKWNLEAFNRLSQQRLKNGDELEPELFIGAIEDGLRGNNFHLPYRRDPITNARIGKRGETLHPPVMPRHVLWPDESALIERESEQEALQLGAEESQMALKMSFEELQALVRKHHKRGGAQ